ncbi:MAG: energy-coupling factor transporter transmembrane protein EcfT [Magnetococcus sp. DMHC-1]|nr:hypothetical protein [Magnetococcales bacterium]
MVVGKPGTFLPVLAECHPRAKLGAFFLLLLFQAVRPVGSLCWWLVAAMVAAAWPWAGLRGRDAVRVVWRLRWFLVLLILFHGLLTPGEALWENSDLLTWEGLQGGAQQTGRLLLLAAASWLLMATTSPSQLLAIWPDRQHGLPTKAAGPAKPIHGFERGLSVIAYALGRVPRLLYLARNLRGMLRLRLGETGPILGGRALLLRVLREMDHQEEALRSRGFGASLPTVRQASPPWNKGDTLLILLTVFPWLGCLMLGS